MAVSEADTSDGNSDSSLEGTKQSERKDKHLSKIVVRRLPPSMNTETFLNQVSPLPDYDYMYFVKADMSLGEFAYSRAYINFKNPSDIFIFKEKFDNYVFLDSRGNEYVAVVEFAPFSRMPKKRNKIRCDPKCGTIESDPVYKEFIESLNQVTNETEEKPEYCFQPTTEDEKKIVNTPLLDFIKQRRLDRQKMREEKREERKRRELERKRIREDERKGRKRIEHNKYASSIKADNDETKSDLKLKETRKMDDYRQKSDKKFMDKRSYSSSKDMNRTDLKKSPPKIRQRNLIDKDIKRTEYKSKRDEFSTSKLRKDEKEEKVVEKKVKKYSERREERKNEFKKQETKTETSTNENKNTDKQDSENVESKMFEKEEIKNDYEKSEQYKENIKGHTRERNDPRTQRRIRNKDRPAMAIYQPGMGLNRHRKLSDEDGQKTLSTDTKSQ